VANTLLAGTVQAGLPAACFTPAMRAQFWNRMQVLLELDPSSTPERSVMASLDRDAAQALSQSLERRDPRWYEYVPSCPRKDPRASADWILDDVDTMDCFHPGAATCYRSAQQYASAEGEGHEQQCCYDKAADLLVPDPADPHGAGTTGAGTPDFAGSTVPPPQPGVRTDPRDPNNNPQYLRVIAAARHARFDVIPFLALDGDAAAYIRYWPPNRGPILLAPGETGAVRTAIALHPSDIVLLEAQRPAGVRLSVPSDQHLLASVRGTDGRVSTPVPIAGTACVISRVNGELVLQRSGGSDPPQQELLVGWRRLVASNQCDGPMVTIPPGRSAP
jgi:hypothetical protein